MNLKVCVNNVSIKSLTHTRTVHALCAHKTFQIISTVSTIHPVLYSTLLTVTMYMYANLLLNTLSTETPSDAHACSHRNLGIWHQNCAQESKTVCQVSDWGWD